MSTESKKHHFVPQSILKNFAKVDNPKGIYVYDKKNGKYFSSSIVDAGSENYFNTIRTDNGNLNFESLFNEFDGSVAKIVQTILSEGRIDNLNAIQIRELLFLVAVQIGRVKIHRTKIQKIERQINTFALELYGEKYPNIELRPISDNEQVKVTTIQYLKEIDSVVDILAKKDIYLIEAKDTQNLYTSDNPVVMKNVFPFGQPGINELGVEIFLPISTNYAVALACPSIKRRMEEFKPIQSPYDLKIYNVLCSKGKLVAEDDFITFLNQLQISESSRFIYSSIAEFKVAEELIKQNPSLQEVESHFGLLKGPQVFPKMPEGQSAVVYVGESHCIIKLRDFSNGLKVSFNTEDILILLSTVGPEMKIDKLEYFENKANTAMMKNMKIVKADIDSKLIELEHADPMIKSVMQFAEKVKSQKNEA